MKISVLNLKNKSVGDIDLDSNIFGVKTLPDLIHQYIRYQNAKSRQGSHKTKTRSEVSGRSKKPFSQKGTGNARQGSNKPPNFRGGAVSMGPVNRDHSFSLNIPKRLPINLKGTVFQSLSDKDINSEIPMDVYVLKDKVVGTKKFEDGNIPINLEVHKGIITIKES